MPCYEFECPKCKIIIEKICNINDTEKPECPECKGRTKKLISKSSFQLKGGGWYKDGY